MTNSAPNKNTAVQFWLADLGAQEFPPGVLVQGHASTASWDLGNRAVYFESGNRVFVTAPPEFVPELKSAFDNTQRAPMDTFLAIMGAKGRIVG